MGNLVDLIDDDFYQKNGMVTADFHIRDATEHGTQYVVHFTYTASLDSWDIFFQRFGDENPFGVVGDTKGEVQVFSSVVAAIEEFISVVEPEYFKFSAKNDESSRISLYRRMIQRLSSKHPYTVDERRSIQGTNTEFIFTRKSSR